MYESQHTIFVQYRYDGKYWQWLTKDIEIPNKPEPFELFIKTQGVLRVEIKEEDSECTACILDILDVENGVITNEPILDSNHWGSDKCYCQRILVDMKSETRATLLLYGDLYHHLPGRINLVRK